MCGFRVVPYLHVIQVGGLSIVWLISVSKFLTQINAFYGPSTTLGGGGGGGGGTLILCSPSVT